MESKFCHVCGGKLATSKGNSQWCEQCQQDYYFNPRPCIEMILFNEAGEVLVSERGQEPAKGMSDIPGGFVDFNETLDEALEREVKEELGLNPDDYSEPHYVMSWYGNYPWGKETVKTVMADFTADLKAGRRPEAKDDVASVSFVPIDQLSKQNFSYDGYPEIIKAAQRQAVTTKTGVTSA